MIKLAYMEESKLSDDKSKKHVALMESWRMAIEESMLTRLMEEIVSSTTKIYKTPERATFRKR